MNKGTKAHSLFKYLKQRGHEKLYLVEYRQGIGFFGYWIGKVRFLGSSAREVYSRIDEYDFYHLRR